MNNIYIIIIFLYKLLNKTFITRLIFTRIAACGFAPQEELSGVNHIALFGVAINGTSNN